MRPRGGERGVPGVPGAERDIPGGGETVLPVTSGRGAQGQAAPTLGCPGGHALPWAYFAICTVSYLTPHFMAPRAPRSVCLWAGARPLE